MGAESEDIDWAGLRAAARAAARRAYVPYSNFPVGAAGLADDGRTISGCNVENASYGLALCAECSLVSALHSAAEPGEGSPTREAGEASRRASGVAGDEGAVRVGSEEGSPTRGTGEASRRASGVAGDEGAVRVGSEEGSPTRKARPPRLLAVAVVDRHGDPLMPCGRCRQLLWEHGGPAMPLDTARGIRPLAELLPDAFGPEDLAR